MKIIFRNILEISPEIQRAVRSWRNQEAVRKYMYTDHEITAEEHQNWLAKLEDDRYNQVFVVFGNDEPIGLVSVNALHYTHKTADWAFYLKDPESKSGAGVLIEYHLLNYVFEELKLSKLNCEVLEINQAVIKLHQKFGFSLEGIRRKNVLKNGERLDVHLLGITNEKWQVKKPDFAKIVAKLSS